MEGKGSGKIPGGGRCCDDRSRGKASRARSGPLLNPDWNASSIQSTPAPNVWGARKQLQELSVDDNRPGAMVSGAGGETASLPKAKPTLTLQATATPSRAWGGGDASKNVKEVEVPGSASTANPASSTTPTKFAPGGTGGNVWDARKREMPEIKEGEEESAVPAAADKPAKGYLSRRNFDVPGLGTFHLNKSVTLMTEDFAKRLIPSDLAGVKAPEPNKTEPKALEQPERDVNQYEVKEVEPLWPTRDDRHDMLLEWRLWYAGVRNVDAHTVISNDLLLKLSRLPLPTTKESLREAGVPRVLLDTQSTLLLSMICWGHYPSLEKNMNISCNNCRGYGHPALICPNDKAPEPGDSDEWTKEVIRSKARAMYNHWKRCEERRNQQQ